ncbi:MAG: type II toxin-antitoxin system Phd/YefM family antitoxin [Proteobacteria bacterium]|uniref:type II toxin-antitoxin system Phd/YefM family antitoxin n=1 Tax=Ottowia sp. TaxID=1898956 RepID=UPI001DF099E7|nr:type II toxin-antitoxin system prevent-host-death family antitoxin [Ottowia sp.]MBS0400900.1 type II toxin-antitoxin system Phd/YefM family antitoxin [Pseudomonadota bacterium]MBS0412827.1 type II toxin-antitoxin system Phd/YefM family antitoxin [Pseudomonadota bacterium]
MTAAAIGLFEAKTHLSELVARAERGEEVIITRHNKPVAKIVPMSATPARVAEDIPPFIQRTHDMGVPKMDLRQANQLLGDMDAEEFLKLQARLEVERQQGKS